MHRTSTVTAMVRSSCGVIILTGIVLLIVLPVGNTAAYALEREATVELLPNDLVSEDREEEQTNKAIATPKQVIEHQVSKAWRTILRKMFDETRTSIKQKRTLPDLGQYTYMAQMITLFLYCAKAGLFAGHFTNSLDALGASHSESVVSNLGTDHLVPSLPGPASSLTPGNMLHDLPTGNVMPSLPVPGSIPDATLVHDVPGTLTGEGLVPEYGLVPGTDVVGGAIPVDTGFATGIAGNAPAVVPLPAHGIGAYGL